MATREQQSPQPAQPTQPQPTQQEAQPKGEQPAAVTRAQVERLPDKYDNAPPAVQGEPVSRDPNDRESWGAKPSFEQARDSKVELLLRTADPKSVGTYTAGLRITPTPMRISGASLIASKGENYLRALLDDPAVEVKIA